MAERGSQSTTMIGSWRSLGLLGRGGTATVLEVEGIGGGRRRALKLAHDRGCSGAILAEVAALSTLYHPAIPSIDACGIDDEGRAWLVREPIDGQALDEVIASRRADPRVLRDLLDQCLDLLLYLDAQGRCHGDIKPQNILVEGEGDELRLRVLDLGAEAEVMTPMYATPERLSEERAPRLSDDLFALAVSFWQGLTGAHPYPGYPAELPEAGTPGVDADPEAGLNEIADFLRPLLLLEVGARLSSLQHVLRHREGLWPDAAALPLEASLRHRLCHAPFVPLADETEAAFSAWLEDDEGVLESRDGDEPRPHGEGGDRTAALLLGPPGSGRSRALQEWALRIGRSGRRVERYDLSEYREAEALLRALEPEPDSPQAGIELLLIDHVDRSPAPLKRALRVALERRSLAAAKGSERPAPRCLLVVDDAQAFPGVPGLQLTALPRSSLAQLIDAVFLGATVRPGDREAWARAHEGQPASLLRALAWALDQGPLRASGATLELGHPGAAIDAGLAAADPRAFADAGLGSGQALVDLVRQALLGDADARACAERRLAGGAEDLLGRAFLAETQGAALAELLEGYRSSGDAVLLGWRVIPYAALLRQDESLPIPARLALAEALAEIGESELARAGFEALLESAEGSAATRGLARLALSEGRWEFLNQWAEALSDDARAEDALVATEAALLQGRYAEAAAYIDKQGEAVLSSDAHWPWLRAMLAFYRSDYEEAAVFVESCRAQAPDAEPAPELSNMAGIIAERRGAFDEAERAYSEALRVARARWDRRYLWKVAMNLGVLKQRSQKPYEALEHYRESLSLAAVTGNREGLMKVSLNLGNLLSTLGHDDEAVPYVESARDLAVALDDPFTRHYAEVVLGEAARWQNQAERSRELLLAAIAGFEALGNARERLAAEIDLAVGEALSERHEDACQRLERLLHGPESLRFPDLRLVIARQLGLAAGFGPDVPRRAARLAAAASLLEHDESEESLIVVWRQALEEGRHADALGLSERAEAALDKRLEPLVPADRERVAQRRPWPRIRAELRFTSFMRGSLQQSTRTRFRALLEVTERLNSDDEPARLLDLLLDEAIRFTGAERGFILLDTSCDEGARPSRDAVKGLRVVAARNIDQEQIRRKEHKVSYGIAADVLSSGEPLATVDAMSDDRYREYLSIHKLRLRSVLCHPLRIAGQSRGVLYLDNRFAPSLFGSDELYAIRILSDHAGIALTRKGLLDDLAAREAELRRSHDEIARLNEQLTQELDETHRKLAARERDLQRYAVKGSFPGIIGESQALRRCLFMVERVRDADVPVLIQGESGTGKELIARALHFQGQRHDRAFVAVNCGAIPANLFESELFGHKRGSFTGATSDKPGLFETADGGTIFLDEIADLPADMQVKLLRVLQSGEVRRIGDSISRSVQVRIVAALNRDLKTLVAEGSFREDLYYRLNVVNIVIPPLRERRDDIPLLVHHFLARQLEEGFAQVSSISGEALRLLVDHAWPGNVRQLETAIKNASLFASGTELVLADFSDLATFEQAPSDLAGLLRSGLDRGMRLKDFEDLLIRQTLELCQGNKKKSAERLGIDRRTLYNRLAAMEPR